MKRTATIAAALAALMAGPTLAQHTEYPVSESNDGDRVFSVAEKFSTSAHGWTGLLVYYGRGVRTEQTVLGTCDEYGGRLHMVERSTDYRWVNDGTRVVDIIGRFHCTAWRLVHD